MKITFIGLVFIAAAGSAFAQVATPILPPSGPRQIPTGTFTMSGCVSGPGLGTGRSPRTGATAVPTSSVSYDSLISPAPPETVFPIVVAPYTYEPPLYVLPPPPEATLPGAASPGDVGAVGTAGMTAPAAVGGLGSGPIGYRLTGSDMSSWIGRRVQVIGTMDLVQPPIDPTLVDTTNPATFPDFYVQSVVPLTGACPR